MSDWMVGFWNGGCPPRITEAVGKLSAALSLLLGITDTCYLHRAENTIKDYPVDYT